MRNAAITSLIFAVVAVLWLSADTVQSHVLGFDSVDACEIRWDDSTRYDDEREAAQDAWEDLKGDNNCVDLEPDTWNTFADLDWRDVNYSGYMWGGYYSNLPGLTDAILMNVHILSDYTPCKRKTVAMHELGHAHGLDHNYIHSDTVMYGVYLSSSCTLGAHDIEDYEELWADAPSGGDDE